MTSKINKIAAGIVFANVVIGIALAPFGAQAQVPYWWDANGTASGFGTAGGMWGSSASLTISAAGTGSPSNPTTTTSDTLNFGTTTGGGALATGTITVNNTQSISAFVFGATAGAIILSGGTINFAATGTITVNNASDTIGSIITGAGTSLTKAGSGALTLSGVNTCKGNTTVSAGTLTVTSAGALYGTGTISVPAGVTVKGGATLRLAGWSYGELGGLQSLSRSSGTIVLGDATTEGIIEYVGTGNANARQANRPLTISAGGGRLTASNSSGTWYVGSATDDDVGNTWTSSAGGTLTLTGTGTGSMGARLPGSGGLAKTGTGTWTLTGANTYSGNTTVSEGTLRLNKASLNKSADVFITTDGILDLNFAGTNNINAFFIDGEQQASGKWGRIGSMSTLAANYESALITGNGLLSATNGAALSAWQLWQIASFGSNDPAIAGTQGDPDHDGVVNILEYALGRNPKVADAGTLSVFDINQTNGACYLRLSVTKNPAALDIQWIGESIGDLSSTDGWSSAGTTIEIDNANQFVVRDNTSFTNAPCHFLRLRPFFDTSVGVEDLSYAEAMAELNIPYRSDLPQLFVCGDSISVGYGPPLKGALRDQLNLVHWRDLWTLFPEIVSPLGAYSGRAASVIEYTTAVLNSTNYNPDILLLNCGLHDVNGGTATQYEIDLNKLVRLAKTNSTTLVWVQTTPEAPGLAINSTIDNFNAISSRVMASNSVPVIDLHTFTMSLISTYGVAAILRTDNVHCTPFGFAAQGAYIASELTRILTP